MIRHGRITTGTFKKTKGLDSRKAVLRVRFRENDTATVHAQLFRFYHVCVRCAVKKNSICRFSVVLGLCPGVRGDMQIDPPPLHLCRFVGVFPPNQKETPLVGSEGVETYRSLTPFRPIQ